MSESVTVLKFGGTSVEDAAAFQRAAAIVRAHPGPRVVVVSAISRMTDALYAAADRSAAGDAAGALAGLEIHFDRHAAVARRILAAAAAAAFARELAAARTALATLFGAGARDAAARDAVAAWGERLSAALMGAVLAGDGADARVVDPGRCIVTDGEHGAATPLQPATSEHTVAVLRPLLEAGCLPVLGGFVAATIDGATTTLGRGGSDVTAALVGAALGAAEVQIWTDVPGVLTADPRLVPDARTIARLSYAEAAELAYFGAKVLHPRTIEPAVTRGVPVRILSSRDPGGASTLVAAEPDGRRGTIKAIAHKGGISVVQLTAARMLGTYGFLQALFEVFTRHRTVVDVVTTSEVSVSLTLEHPDPRPELLAELLRLGAVTVDRDCAIVCVVGDGLRNAPGVAARVFDAIRDVNVSMISQGASRVNLTFVVPEARVAEVVRRLHAAVFASAAAPVAATGTA
jgi:aspartate kinase